MFDEKYRKLFGRLPLEKPLFYNASAALRFELGEPGLFKEPGYMERVYKRAFILFKEIFHPDDKLWIVVYQYHSGHSQKRTSIFRHYIKKPHWSIIEGGL